MVNGGRSWWKTKKVILLPTVAAFSSKNRDCGWESGSQKNTDDCTVLSLQKKKTRALDACKLYVHSNRIHEKQKLHQIALQKEIHLYKQIQPEVFSEFREGQK